ncbi:MAG: type I methionyl aminopeptidase [bacterium]|nr:type I methionyl aminopeptidase [bacterium]MDZ4205789.1 type I methionyl aminopeptidase [Patescibacteria group bacterium]
MIRLKNPEEIEILREGGRRLAEILLILGKRVRPGVSALFLEEEARRLIKEGGDRPAFLGYKPQGAKRPFPAALCVSINDEIVHGVPNEAKKILREGDIVSLDFGILHRGLITDAAITVPVGVVDDESKKLMEVTKRALKAGIKAAIPGNTIGDIGEAINTVVKTGQFSLADDLVGHGVGYAVHEDPYVPNFGIKGKGEKLVPGLVIAIEPMVNVGKPGIKILSDGYTIKTRDGSRSAHFEHTVAITEKGSIVLTASRG